MPKLALLDGHSLAYRAFYALPADLATTAGQVTNAVFGFTSMLIKLLGDTRPDAIAVAWDVKGPTFRKERYAQYKAQREAPPDLFIGQLPLIHEVLAALRIKQVEVPGFEADDVIATLATTAAADGWEVLVVTGDRDAFQLVAGPITVLYTRRGISDTVVADEAWIRERYGIGPEVYRDYAALRGDPSDNLPGVPGVGEKTASKLIATYGSIDGVFTYADEHTPKLRENLLVHRDQVFLNRDLMTLVRDVEVIDDAGHQLKAGAFTVEEWDRAEVQKVFDGLAFRTLWDRLQELGGGASVVPESLDVDVRTTLDPAGLPQGPGPLPVAAVWDADLLSGVVIAHGSEAVFVPADALGACGPAFVRRGIAAHDAKPIIRALSHDGVTDVGVAFDTALAAYLVNPAQRAPGLADLAYRELGLTIEAGEESDADDQVSFDFEGASGPDIEGAARRAVAVARLVAPLRDQIEARGGSELFESIELPLIPILARMETTGIGVDRAFLEDMSGNLRKRLADLEIDIHAAAGGPFNVNSTLQLREVLYERLELPVLKKTPKGVPSTDAAVLAKLRSEHPVVDQLLQYRELEKLRSTYVDALLPLIEDDGRIRGRFNQMAAATGRLSQEQPNLQNIPVRSEEGRTIRRAFVADEGNRLLVADYSQIELRILAHLSGDAGMLQAFHDDIDIHTATAARVGGVAPQDVTADDRRRAKMINFGLLYGMEAFGLAQRLEIAREKAEAHIAEYFSQFPDVKAFMQGIVDEARITGYTTTLLGRRRYLPELSSSNFRTRQMGERMALNAPIQGSAADIIKKAMVDLEGELRAGRYQAEMLLQIHDELVLEVPEEELDAVNALTTETMEAIVELAVPLKVETASGRTLADCKQ